jgi:lipoprotein-anchoring transpeptidase ErfK/SrfK
VNRTKRTLLLFLWSLLLCTATLAEDFAPRPVENWLEAQVALSRLGFSCGSIDGIAGSQTVSALRAFQASRDLHVSGRLTTETKQALMLDAPATTELLLSIAETSQFRKLSPTWQGKSEQPALSYENALEWAAEFSHAHPALVRQLNPGVDWDHLMPGARLRIPAVDSVQIAAHVTRLRIQLAARTLEAFDENDTLVAHFPVSIARHAEKRPEGELHVTVVIADPDYTFDPAVFPESAEARQITGKLILAPGPNNPVGVAWIGLDRPGYGIHGTPSPEQIGRTESHGCFRLANWDARTLLSFVQVGMVVEVLP